MKIGKNFRFFGRNSGKIRKVEIGTYFSNIIFIVNLRLHVSIKEKYHCWQKPGYRSAAAAIGLAVIMVGFGLANLSWTLVLESVQRPSVLAVVIGGVYIGIVSAQGGLLTLWLVWAPFPFWLRHLLHWNAAGGLLLSGMVGAAIAIGPSANDGRWFTDMLIALSILPAPPQIGLS